MLLLSSNVKANRQENKQESIGLSTTIVLDRSCARMIGMASNSIGRPSSYTDEIAAQICERLSNGESLRTICAEESMPSKTTVFRWTVDIPSFRDQYALAREALMEHWSEEIVDIADSADAMNYNPKRLQVDTRKWLMSKLAPKKYGDTANINVSGEITIGIAESLSTARQRLLSAKSSAPLLEATLDPEDAGESDATD